MKTALFVLSFVALAALAAAQDDGLPKVGTADAKALEKLNAAGALAMPLAASTNAISVNFSMAGSKINDAALADLKPVAEQIVSLNLAGTGITDAGLAQIAGLKNLQKLHLEKTAVGDDGLAHLKGLSELRYLNLYSSKVTDKGLAHLSGLAKLQNLYVWQTGVTEAGATGLVKSLPKVDINRGVDVTKLPEPPKAPEGAAAKPVNAKCPVLGKDIDAAVTFTYKNQLIAFCCKDCCGKFAKEPEKFIAKVDGFKAEPAKEEKKADKKKADAKPVNAKCPISGRDVDAAATFTYKSQVIAFCCDNCKGKFEKEPEKFIAKVEGFKAEDKK